MSTNFPEGIDCFVDPEGDSPLANPSHSQQHTKENDAIVAIQTKIGIDDSGDPDSLDYKVTQLIANPGIPNETDGNISWDEDSRTFIVEGVVGAQEIYTNNISTASIELDGDDLTVYTGESTLFTIDQYGDIQVTGTLNLGGQRIEGLSEAGSAGEAVAFEQLRSGAFKTVSTFNVLDFGAVGDGSTDDHDGIMAAINAAVSNNGGTVVFPQTGHPYYIASTLGSTDSNYSGIRFEGDGYRHEATEIIGASNGSYDMWQGLFAGCEFYNLVLNGNNTTAIPLNISMNGTLLQSIHVNTWAGDCAINLCDPDVYSQGGFLCAINDIFIGDGPLPATGALRKGYGMRLHYPLTDTYMTGGTIGAALANVWCDGGPFRFTNVHFDGNPDYNILLMPGGTITVGAGCILENTQREAIVVDLPTYNTTSFENKLIISGGVIFRGESLESSGKYPAVSIRGVGATIKAQSLIVNGCDLTDQSSDSGSKTSHAIELTNTDHASIIGNNWWSGHAGANPVLAIGATNVDVTGNGGDNGIDGIPSDPSTLQGVTLAAWWHGDDLTSGSISSWTDASGNSRAMVQANSGNQPTVGSGPNGTKAAVFTSGKVMTSSDVSAFDRPLGVSAHCVFNLTNLPSTGNIAFALTKGTNPQWSVGIDANGKIVCWVNAGAGNERFIFCANVVYTAGTWVVVSAFYDGYAADGAINGLIAAGTEYTNGAMIAESLPAKFGQDGFGNAQFVGSIAEAIVTDGPISRGNRAAIDAYLMNKYALTPR